MIEMSNKPLVITIELPTGDSMKFNFKDGSYTLIEGDVKIIVESTRNEMHHIIAYSLERLKGKGLL